MLLPTDKTQKMLFGWATRRKEPLSKVAPSEDPTLHPSSDIKSLTFSPNSTLLSQSVQFTRKFSFSRLFSLPRVMTVVLVVSGTYFFGIARDRFVSESDFVVRLADSPSQGVTGNPLAHLLGASSQNSLEDARYLRVYLSSPQVLQDLMRVYDFDKAFSRNQSDPFAGLPPGASREARLKFFQKQVQVVLDENSGVISLVTVGLSPESALKLNSFLLQKSEEFVNRLNQNIGVKQLEFAEQELARVRRPLQEARDKLLRYQRTEMVVDAEEEAKATTAVISSMEKKLGEMKVELFTLQQQFKSPDEPEVLALADQVSQLQRMIEKERQGVVSNTGRNLTRKAADQLKLEADVEFATDLYKTALVASEKARVETRRQQKFMAVLSSPLSADSPARNWRYRGFFTCVALVLVTVSLTKFILGMQANHRE